jgi:hypothetical protein
MCANKNNCKKKKQYHTYIIQMNNRLFKKIIITVKKMKTVQALVAHTCVILATQEAEIRRIAIQSQPRQIVCETPHLKKNQNNKKKTFTKKGWWNGSRCRLSLNPSTAKKRKKEGSQRDRERDREKEKERKKRRKEDRN